MDRKTTIKEYFCVDCGVGVTLPLWQYKKHQVPFRCNKCARVIAANTYKSNKVLNPEKWENMQQAKKDAAHRKHSKTTADEKTIHGKKMRAAVTLTGTEMRARQQLFIDNAGIEYYNAYCAKRKQISLAFHASLTPELKEQHYRKIFKTTGRSKACEKCFVDIEDYDISILREQYINGYCVDGIVTGTKIIIEFYGDIFHCNPIKFHDPNQYCSWIGRTVQEQWDRDKCRIAALLHSGYRVIIIWESDWNFNKTIQIERVQNEMCTN